MKPRLTGFYSGDYLLWKITIHTTGRRCIGVAGSVKAAYSFLDTDYRLQQGAQLL